MNKLLAPAAAALAILALAGGAAFALTGGSTSDDTQQTGGDALGICVEGTVDCDDTITDPDNPTIGDPAQTCLEGTPDCDDTPGDALFCDVTDSACEEQHIAIVSDDLAARTSAEVTLVSAEHTKWPDASLGNPQPGMAYAQVITPGYKIVLASGGANYEYHTDTAGNFTLVE